LTPATFQPLPKPRKTTIHATGVPSGPKCQFVSIARSNASKSDVAEHLRLHNERQAQLKPTGFIPGQKCSWCLEAFATQPLYSQHRHVCSQRPGGPLPVGPLWATMGGTRLDIFSVCECGAGFSTRSAKKRHVATGECPLEHVPDPTMCWLCGDWSPTRGEWKAHRHTCVRQGAD
jgi:hypothetical protein